MKKHVIWCHNDACRKVLHIAGVVEKPHFVLNDATQGKVVKRYWCSACAKRARAILVKQGEIDAPAPKAKKAVKDSTESAKQSGQKADQDDVGETVATVSTPFPRMAEAIL